MGQFLFTIFARLIAAAAAILPAVYSTSLRWKIGAPLGAAVATLFLDYWQLVRPQRKLEDVVQKLVDEYFKALSDQALKLRKNALLRFSVLVPRRRWQTLFISRHLFQKHQFNFSGHADIDLHFSIKEGVAGFAIREREQKVYLENFQNYSAEQLQQKFYCSPKLLAATAKLKAVAAVPLYAKSRIPWRHERLVGVLCADTRTDEGVAVLANASTQDAILLHAKLVQITMGG